MPKAIEILCSRVPKYKPRSTASMRSTKEAKARRRGDIYGPSKLEERKASVDWEASLNTLDGN